MQPEAYLDFSDPRAIRLRGHRVWIEHVLYEYLYNKLSAEQLIERFDSLNFEKIDAVLLYYHQHQAEMDAYMQRWLEQGEQMRRQQAETPSPLREKMRQRRAERTADRSPQPEAV